MSAIATWAVLALVASAEEPPAETIDPRIEEAIHAYQSGAFSRARQRLESLGERAADSARALMYLAATHYELGEHGRARGVLKRLARRHPAVRLSPAVFVPPLIALADLAREEVEREGSAVAKAPASPEAVGEPPGAMALTQSRPLLEKPAAAPGTRVWTWVSAGAAGVALASAAYFGFSANADRDSFMSNPDRTREDADRLSAGALANASRANLAYGIAGAAGGAAVALFFIEGRC